MKKHIKEFVTVPAMIAIAITSFFFSIRNVLTPEIMLLMLFAHIALYFSTGYRESLVHPIIHFNRSLEGVLILSTPLVFFCYEITWFMAGMNEFAIARAQFCCAYTYIILFLFSISVNNIAGPFFLYSMVFELSPRLIVVLLPFQSPSNSDQPFVIVPTLILLSIFSVFGFLSTIFLTLDCIKEKDFFNGQIHQYKKYALAKIALNLVVLIIFIVLRTEIIDLVIQNLNSN